jgi:threonine/homoserine/homoserine lactone efflux protein
MEYVQHIIIGLSVGFLGVLPPGLLNLTAAKISLKQGSASAHLFALGASVVVIGQAYIGVFFSKLLLANEDLLFIMEQVAAVVFIVLAVFFFIKAWIDKQGEITIKTNAKSPLRLFGQGLMLSILNIFPIPFYLAFSSFLGKRGWFIFEQLPAYLFIGGVVIGTFCMLSVYIKYIRRFSFDSSTFARKTNFVLSALTLLIAVFTLLKLYNE